MEPPIKLLNDQVLVRKHSEKQKEIALRNATKIIKEPPKKRGVNWITGEVVAVGPGIINLHSQTCERIPMDCAQGDHVVFLENQDVPFGMNGETFTLLRDVNVVGIVAK